LVELMVVIFIITLVSTIAGTNLSKGRKIYNLMQATQRLMADIRVAQNYSLNVKYISSSPKNYYAISIEDPVGNSYSINAFNENGAKTTIKEVSLPLNIFFNIDIATPLNIGFEVPFASPGEFNEDADGYMDTGSFTPLSDESHIQIPLVIKNNASITNSVIIYSNGLVEIDKN